MYVTSKQTCPQHNGLGRNLRSKTRWFMGFCNPHQISHFSTFFIDARVEISIVESHFDFDARPVLKVPTANGVPRGERRLECSLMLLRRGFDNDPSAGSPMETLLRLLLPLNDKGQWTSRDVVGSRLPTSPRSEHFTGPFYRQERRAMCTKGRDVVNTS
ncbi:Hypothetical predicted protein [Olea europaea subsp. europaea]|uniref:Uncharacterized protein n=1 Tax=Olea europaea subsp. europaea TaxID=158383 RepID=A0A8S0VMZ7_OLEEU|nr:Hypothetical predicted protein [Olea europaea subsp. europaea]